MNRFRNPLVLPLLLSSVAACAGQRMGPAGELADRERWPAMLVGSWAFVDSPSRTDAEMQDTVVWELGPRGGLRHATVDVAAGTSAQAAARVRTTQQAVWWTELRKVDGEMTRVMCTSAYRGRSRQCGRVQVDTVTGAQGSAHRRFSWIGVTFPQRWIFVERSSAPPAERGTTE